MLSRPPPKRPRSLRSRRPAHDGRTRPVCALLLLAVAAAFAIAVSGCRGQASDRPPFWIKHGMEYQPGWRPYGKNAFYPDGRNLRHPPEGTVARGGLKEDDVYWRGGMDTVRLAARIPVPVDMDFLERGRERFAIYCTPCHGGTGAGDGMVVKRGFQPPPSFHEDRIVALPDGQLFRTISFGVRAMPAYGKQVPEADRWAIVAYIRALQRSQRATLEELPQGEREKLR